MRKQNLTKLITIILCIALAFTGGIYQYSHSKEVSKNANQQAEAENGLKKVENNDTSTNYDEISQEDEKNYQPDTSTNASEDITFPISELGENNEDVTEETADGYYSNDIIGIDNLEVLTNEVGDIESYELKNQLKSYLVLSGYDDIYQISIDENSISKNDDGYSFNTQITDTEILNVTCLKEENKYIFKIL